MTRREAQEILLRHHAGGVEDEETEKALELTRRDPELGSWWREQERFHQDFRAALEGVEPPAGLKTSILARRKVVSPPWRRASFVWAAAAAVALLALGLVFWQRPREEPTFSVFQSRMVQFALRRYQMDIETSDEKAVRSYLQQQGSPAEFPLPDGLRRLPVKGGGSFTWKGQPVSMLCFDWQGQETFYLFVIEQNHVENATLPEAPAVIPYRGTSTAAWETSELVYLLVAKTEQDTLRSLL